MKAFFSFGCAKPSLSAAGKGQRVGQAGGQQSAALLPNRARTATLGRDAATLPTVRPVEGKYRNQDVVGAAGDNSTRA